MKRYAITPILSPEGENGYRTSAADIPGTSYTSLIPVDSQTGVPLYGFCFNRIGRVDFGPVFLLTNSYIFPDYPLDGALEGMEAAVRNAMKQSVEAYDMDGNGWHLNVDLSDLSISYEALLASIFLQIDPLQTLANFRRFDTTEGS